MFFEKNNALQRVTSVVWLAHLRFTLDIKVFNITDKWFICDYLSNLLEVNPGPCNSCMFLSTVDVSLNVVHIYHAFVSATLLGVCRRGGFSYHIVYTHPQVYLASVHLVCFVLQGVSLVPWTFLRDLRTLLCSWGFPFSIFNVKIFSGGRSKVSRILFYCPFCLSSWSILFRMIHQYSWQYSLF